MLTNSITAKVNNVLAMAIVSHGTSNLLELVVLITIQVTYGIQNKIRVGQIISYNCSK